MPDIWNQPWFGWALGIVLGLPIVLLILTEINNSLVRRGNPAASTIRLLRNFVVPVGALLILITLVADVKVEVTWVRVVATVFGFLVILLLLSGVNVVLFRNAAPGTWRDRLPSIFIDLARILLIVVGLAILFSWVWNADVGGLIAALGVTSIVIGLALQNAVGGVISGLLLLFEQPFRLGDWLDADGTRGRVVEVNWRAVHIDTGNGIQVIPNASLSGSSFTNLSRAQGAYAANVPVSFTTDDAPHEVAALLIQTASGLPQLRTGANPSVAILGKGGYSLTVPLNGPAEEGDAVTLLLSWLWYASRRHGLNLDGDTTDDYPTTERRRAALERVAPTLYLAADDVTALADRVVIERYGAGETVQRVGSVPIGMRFVIEGTASLIWPGNEGERVPVGTVTPGSYFGQTALTRELALSQTIAQTPLVTLLFPREVIDELVTAKPALARDIGKAIDTRRASIRAALESAGRADLLH